MDDLTAFLAARLDEDERYLKSNAHHLWTQRPFREVEAKRAILARYEDCLARMDDPMYSGLAEGFQIREYEDFVLPNHAAVYSDHPEYRPEWKP